MEETLEEVAPLLLNSEFSGFHLGRNLFPPLVSGFVSEFLQLMPLIGKSQVLPNSSSILSLIAVGMGVE